MGFSGLKPICNCLSSTLVLPLTRSPNLRVADTEKPNMPLSKQLPTAATDTHPNMESLGDNLGLD